MEKTKKAIVIFAFAVIFLCGIICRYFYLMVLSPRDDSAATKNYRVERGPILDRNGVVLAIQTRLFRVFGWRPTLKNPDYVAKKLSEILEIPEEEIKEKFNRKGGDLIQLARKVSFEAAEKIQDLIKSGEISGIRVDNDYGRLYPEKELASHLIGFAGDDNKGLDGIERQMDRYLFPVGNQEAISGVVYGNQVYLTIDVNIQNFAQQASMDIMEQYEPIDGVITLVADAKTGEILAYVSMPELDLNNYTKYSADDPIKRNKPVIYTYEPGSVFKVFSISSFMHIPNGITPESRFFCNGFYTNISGNPIKCTGHHGDIDTGDIIKYSCNPGTCMASESVTPEEFYFMIKQFGFGEASGVELPEEKGSIRPTSRWSDRSKPTIAMGQEVQVNAMQIMKAATVISNHGTMLMPHVIKKVVDATGHVVFENERQPIMEVVSPKVADSMLLMMERASVDRGTARRHNVGGVRMSMKTGTAQVYDDEIKKYSDDKFTASCIAIFPTEDPQYIIYNVAFHPMKGGITTGAGIAVPAVGKLANDIISYKGMARTGDTVLGFDGTINASQEKNFAVIDVVPDFTGASKKHLLPLFKDDRFNLVIKGEGWVVRQSPEPGTPVEPGMTLEFELQ
ncbi:MAG: transpeptidase family protein [Spirochaetia bacterium]|nr:transpeptidase family protein [Spirochaetia bacterium]MBQ3647673.1 transpeptidase family protein [Spirochaetia bacterium]MBQ3713277.1 transpeptidase family protein [Spirochaetia bacterium]MBQ6674122.1 transpeptidase family protein [Spirochaetia bacterium]